MALPTPALDRTALVTGASSGIGEEIARDLARRGHGVTLVARREEKLQALADELATAHAIRAEVLAADLADPASRAEVIEAVEERGLTIDVLVNNAGLSTAGPVHRSDVDDELRMVRVDVEAVVDLCSRVLPAMVERGRGAVMNVASVGSFQPLPGQAGYGASKAFVLAYTQGIQGELKGTGVTISALCPGPVRTGFGEAAGLDPAASEAALPSFMWVEAEEVARAGVAGLDKGRGVVIPGPANAVAAQFGRIAPRSLLVPLLARQHPALKD